MPTVIHPQIAKSAAKIRNAGRTEFADGGCRFIIPVSNVANQRRGIPRTLNLSC